MNDVKLIGRLTADVELKQTPNGILVSTFTIAVERPHTKDVTDFINCVAWRNTAEFISRWFHKGDKIGVSGVLTQRRYEDKNGNNRSVYEVVIDYAEFCGAKQKEEQTEPETENKEPNFENIPDDGDLPF